MMVYIVQLFHVISGTHLRQKRESHMCLSNHS